jgi:hypothetical protein
MYFWAGILPAALLFGHSRPLFLFPEAQLKMKNGLLGSWSCAVMYGLFGVRWLLQKTIHQL